MYARSFNFLLDFTDFYNGGHMGRYKTYLTILLMFSIHMMPFNAARAAGLGGWSLGGGVSQGASVIYNGSKEVILNGAKKLATGTAKITPTAANVARVLARGGATAALTIAVEQLLGAVDWVLDPENNQITYTKPIEPTDPNDPTVPRIWALGANEGGGYIYASKEQAGRAMCSIKGGSYSGITWTSSGGDLANVGCIDSNGNVKQWNLLSIANPSYDPDAETDNKPKHLPLDTVAQQVISNAESGNADAQSAVRAAADTIVAEAETDNTKARPIVQQLENTQSIPTDQTAKGEAVPKENANTENPASSPTTSTPTDISLDFPIFCDWAPSVCQAAKVVITKPVEWAENIKVAYDDAVDYFKSEPEETDNELDIDQNTDSEPDSSISFSTSCPAKIPLTFQWNGGTLDFSFDFTMWCEAISTYVYPIVVALGSLHALYIVAGVRQDG